MHDKYGKHHNELLVNLANSSRDHPRASTYINTLQNATQCILYNHQEEMILVYIAGVLTGLILALVAMYVAAKLQHAHVTEGHMGNQELLDLIKQQNLLFNSYRYVDKSL